MEDAAAGLRAALGTQVTPYIPDSTSTSPLQRFLDLPSDASDRGLVLRYGYQRGMVIVYDSVVTVYRSCYGEPHFVSSSSQEDLEAYLRVKIIDVDEADNGARLIVYHEPRHHRIRGRNIAPSSKSVVYIKQNEFGEIIESTHPGAGANLILPRMAVTPMCGWKEIERFVPPRRIHPVELVRDYRVTSIEGSQVQIAFQIDDLTYSGETEGDEDTECFMGGRGEFHFDTEWGVVTRQSVENTTRTARRDVTFELQTVYTMELVDE